MEKRVNGALTKLEWDNHNRLSRPTAPDGQRTDYHYNPLDRHTAKTQANLSTQHTTGSARQVSLTGAGNKRPGLNQRSGIIVAASIHKGGMANACGRGRMQRRQ
ncbi:hypothetical protein [Chromobacterium aquaticum]|uniref:YD repeat-containing protein n=1 Tax=Chromobacterium aquaticum TaxID=467180 RepID=A0ABV8ZXB6_9NEIS|nr:hypothetical protein [Chromobacterium aquaticum]MCD5361839.1 hypothetical protein [Chromobacterium aquaticum]